MRVREATGDAWSPGTGFERAGAPIGDGPDPRDSLPALRRVLRLWSGFSVQNFRTDEDLDVKLVDYVNLMQDAGRKIWTGQKLMAGVLFLYL